MLSIAVGRLRSSFPVRLYRYAVLDSLRIIRQRGFRALIRERGWRFVAAIVGYYLVRDTAVYVFIPLLGGRGWLW